MTITKVFVTGHQGFIGSHLCRVLAQEKNHVVRSMDAKQGMTTANWAQVKHTIGGWPDLIVHLGANCSTSRSLDDPLADFHSNALGTVNIAELARLHGIPVLYTSTCKVDPGADGKTAPLGLSKAVGELYLQEFKKLYGLRYVTLQPSTIYGPGQAGTAELGWVTHFIQSAVRGSQIVLNGSGEQSRDILYISDFVALLRDIIGNFEMYEGGTYPVGGGAENEVSLLGMLEHLGHTNVVHKDPLQSDLQRVVTDNSLITGVNGWRPTTPWKTGVKNTMESM